MMAKILDILKRILKFKLLSKNNELNELVEIHNNLLCRLATSTEEAGENIVKAIRDIDRKLN